MPRLHMIPQFLRKKEKPDRAATLADADSDPTALFDISAPVDQAYDTSITSTPEPKAAVPTSVTLKNAVLFATKIASNASVPWVKIVTESVLQVTKRLDVSPLSLVPAKTPLISTQTMTFNAEASRTLERDIKAFLYIVARATALFPDDQIVQLVKKCAFLDPSPSPADGD
jgi:hypothetical protein